MITGDNPLTAVSVAQQVEIVDRDTLILDQREGATDEAGASHFLSPLSETISADLCLQTSSGAHLTTLRSSPLMRP